jgi:DNA primase
VLAFDADAAGEQATLRGVDLLVELGLDVRVAELPGGVDPDEYVQSHGREKLEQVFEQAVSIFEFLLEVAVKRHPGNAMEKRVAAAQFVLPTIARVPNAMLRSEYVRLLADRLKLDPAAVTAELAKAQQRQAGAPAAAKPAAPVRPKAEVAQGPERMLAALLLDDAARWDRRPEWLGTESLADPSLRRVIEVIDELREAGAPVTPAQVASRVAEDGLAGLVAELVELAQTIASRDAVFEECLQRLGKQARDQRRAVLLEQIRQAQSPQEQERLLKEFQSLGTTPQAVHAA